MSNTQQYPVQLNWSDEDNGFIATAPDLPGCSAFGRTQPEALSELQSAIEAWIEAAKAAGNPVPEPSPIAAPASLSGKLLLRMPKSLHAQLVERAKRESVSLNQLVNYLLSGGISASQALSPEASRSNAASLIEKLQESLAGEIRKMSREIPVEPFGGYGVIYRGLSSDDQEYSPLDLKISSSGTITTISENWGQRFPTHVFHRSPPAVSRKARQA